MNTFTDWFAQQKQRVETAKREKIELRAGPPTYPALDSMPVEDARQEFDQVFDEFLRVASTWKRRASRPAEARRSVPPQRSRALSKRAS